MDQLEKLRNRIPEATDGSLDTLLTQLLEDAGTAILDYTNRIVLLPAMESLQRDLALIYYNKQGEEGVTSHNQGGNSVSYSVDIPEMIKSRLNAYRRLKVSNYATPQS